MLVSHVCPAAALAQHTDAVVLVSMLWCLADDTKHAEVVCPQVGEQKDIWEQGGWAVGCRELAVAACSPASLGS